MYLIVYIKKHKCYQGKILELSISSTEQLLFPSTIRATRKIWVSYALKKKKNYTLICLKWISNQTYPNWQHV